MLFSVFLLHHSDSRILDRSGDHPDPRADRQSNWFQSFFPLEGFLRGQAAGGMQEMEDCIPPIHTKKEEESGSQLRAEAKKGGE